jgi:hypothetical protein
LAVVLVLAVALVWPVTPVPVGAPISVVAHVWPVMPVSRLAPVLAVRGLARVVLAAARGSAFGPVAVLAVASLARLAVASAVVPLALV